MTAWYHHTCEHSLHCSASRISHEAIASFIPQVNIYGPDIDFDCSFEFDGTRFTAATPTVLMMMNLQSIFKSNCFCILPGRAYEADDNSDSISIGLGLMELCFKSLDIALNACCTC